MQALTSYPIRLSLGLMFLMLGLVACKPDNPDPFDRESMLSNIGNEVLLPVHRSFLQQSQSLDSLTEVFVGNPTQENLGLLQNQWAFTKRSWKRVEVFEIRQASDLFLHNKIDKWETKAGFLQDNLEGSEALTATFVENSGSTSKGLPALEYFLFVEDALTTFTTAPLADRRLDYIKALTENLFQQATALLNIWEGDVGAFVVETENFSKGSLNQLVNAQVSLLCEILFEKLGKPMGKDTGGTPIGTKAEAYRSGVSLSLIMENLKGVKASFLGDPSLPGMDDLLDHLDARSNNQMLSELIIQQLDLSIQKVAVAPGPLVKTVETDGPILEDLYQTIRTCLGYIKVDMANHLGILITFKDTDGD
ncbi:MAG: imelysin family protein [Bacteroidota bacterium]